MSKGGVNKGQSYMMNQLGVLSEKIRIAYISKANSIY